MAQSVEFYRNFKEQILLTINTGFPAKIISYDKNLCEAKIQPLFKMKEVGYEPETLSVIEGVPTITQRYEVDGVIKEYKPIYKKDEKVYCVCAQRSLDDLSSGKPYYPGKSRVLSMQDAVIVGLLP